MGLSPQTWLLSSTFLPHRVSTFPRERWPRNGDCIPTGHCSLPTQAVDRTLVLAPDSTSRSFLGVNYHLYLQGFSSDCCNEGPSGMASLHTSLLLRYHSQLSVSHIYLSSSPMPNISPLSGSLSVYLSIYHRSLCPSLPPLPLSSITFVPVFYSTTLSYIVLHCCSTLIGLKFLEVRNFALYSRLLTPITRCRTTHI